MNTNYSEYSIEYSDRFVFPLRSIRKTTITIFRVTISCPIPPDFFTVPLSQIFISTPQKNVESNGQNGAIKF